MAKWKCTECGEIKEGRCKPKKCPKCDKHTKFEKDE